MIIYFDTNVFDCIEQRRVVTDWDVYRLQRAVKHGQIAIILSFLNIEETLFLVEFQPEKARARIKLMLDMADYQLFAQSQESSIQNDIRTYALGTQAISPFSSLTPSTELNIRNLPHPAGSELIELRAVLDEIRSAKSAFQSFLETGREKLLPHAKSIGGKHYKFEHYWANNHSWLAESMAERAGLLAQVKSRGIDGLLKVKSVGLAVGGNLSLIYSHHFENRVPKPGDSRDILHAIVGSYADVFVTEDGEFRRILNRVPVTGFQAVNLQTLLCLLPQWI